MINRLLRRLRLCREADVIEAFLDLRSLSPKYDQPGYISDRKWREAMARAWGHKVESQ